MEVPGSDIPQKLRSRGEDPPPHPALRRWTSDSGHYEAARSRTSRCGNGISMSWERNRSTRAW